MKTRSGDGSVTSRKTKTKGVVWDIQLTIKNRRGVSERLSKRGFPTEQSALAWRDEQKRRAKAGQALRPTPLTVPQLCRQYVEASGHLRGSTKRSYLSVLDKHIAKKCKVQASKLDTVTMQRFLNQLHSEAAAVGRSGSGTVKQARRLVMAALNWACRPEVGLIGFNPIAGAKLHDPTDVAQRSDLSPREVTALLSASEPRARLAWQVFLETGCRKGELLGLQWSDVDFDEGVLRIERIATTESGYREVSPRTKGQRRREVPLSASLSALLRAERNSRGINPCGYIFGAPNGQLVGHKDLVRWWAESTAAAGLEGRVMHELRHTWATRALEAGVSPSVVAQILGHTNVATVLTFYRHVSATEMRSAMETVSSQIA